VRQRWTQTSDDGCESDPSTVRLGTARSDAMQTAPTDQAEDRPRNALLSCRPIPPTLYTDEQKSNPT